ncbi:MAG: Bug family tripartite tricarboxylate transporter substrate binding protein [Alphaproteobacteria bacterium]
MKPSRLSVRTSSASQFACRAFGVAIAAGLFAVALPTASLADAVADFYKGKQLSFLVGFGAGGGYDTTTRLVARHFGRHVPGKPTPVVQNMPGGGSLKVLNFLYNEPNLRDGATLGVFNSSAVLEPLYGNKKATFDASKFSWIGSMHSDVQACAVWKGAGVGIKSLQDMVKAKKTIVFGSTGPAAPTTLFPLFFKNALGAPIKVVNGYKGTKDINLAMQRGEADASCGMFESTVRGAFYKDFQSGDLQMFVQVGIGRPTPDIFSKATPISELLTTTELKQAGQLVFGPSVLTRPLSAAPGVPKDRVAALRKALLDTMKDPAMIEDGKKIKVTFAPIPGEEFEKTIAAFYATPPEVVKKAYSFTHTK